MNLRHAAHGIIAITVASGSALAGDTGPLVAPTLSLAKQPVDASTASASSTDTPPPTDFAAFDYTDEKSWWFALGGAVAPDFDDANDFNIHGAITTFLAPKFELGGEVGVWYFDQPGENAMGVSGTLLMRYHFIKTKNWTVFADAGIGMLGSSDDVPAGGTSFNLLPRAGVGITRELTDSGLRFMLGARWHHISNARINGDDENPSRDAPMIYAAFVWPF